MKPKHKESKVTQFIEMIPMICISAVAIFIVGGVGFLFLTTMVKLILGMFI